MVTPLVSELHSLETSSRGIDRRRYLSTVCPDVVQDYTEKGQQEQDDLQDVIDLVAGEGTHA